MARDKSSVDMTQGSIERLLIMFALPLLLGQIFQQLYNAVDGVVVGRFVGKEALAAVGASGNIINALISFFTGLGTGSGVVISQYFGAHNDQGVRDTVHTTVVATLILAVVCTILGVTATGTILKWMDTPADVEPQAAAYLRIYFAGVAGLMFYNIGSGILRAVGDSTRPLYFLIFSALLNLGLDLLFVCVFHMGIEGAAWATIIAQAISAVLTFVVLGREKGSYRVELRALSIKKNVLGQVIKIGLPMAVQTGIISLSNVFVQAYINAFQSACMAGWASYNKLDAFVWLPMLSLGMAVTTFVGQNLGAGKPERARRGVRVSVVLSLVSTMLLVIPMMVFADSFLKIFNGEADVLAYGRMFVVYMSPFYIPYTFTQIYSGALRGAGDSVKPMFICIFSFVIFRQIYLFIGTRFITHPLFVGMGYPAGWMVSVLLMVIAYRRSHWEEKRAIAAD